MALSLAAGLHRVRPALGRSAAAAVGKMIWFEFGYARLDDLARERLDRSGRWVRDLAIPGRKLNELPELESALRGEDGGRPLCQVEALDIARIATSGSATKWIDLARRTDPGRLKDAIRAARESGRSELPDEAAPCAEVTAARASASRREAPDRRRANKRDDGRQADRAGSAELVGAGGGAAAVGLGVDIDEPVGAPAEAKRRVVGAGDPMALLTPAAPYGSALGSAVALAGLSGKSVSYLFV